MFAVAGALVAGTLVAAEAAAQGHYQPGQFGSTRVRLGLFMPDGDSQYWDDTEAAFTGSADDMEDVSLGFDFVWRTTPATALVFSSGFTDGDATRAYREWVDGDGNDIYHGAELETFDLTVAWMVQAAGPPVRPYFGIGGGLVFWELTEAGEFIDFGDPDLSIVYATYYDEDMTLEAVAFAGVEFQVSPYYSLLVEGRYRYADDELGGTSPALATSTCRGSRPRSVWPGTSDRRAQTRSSGH